MKSYRHILIFLCLAVGALPAVAFAEFIPRYEVEIVPHEDSSFSVRETIFYDFGRDYRHGITRDIPLTHPQESSNFWKKRYLEVAINEITMDDEAVNYTVEEDDSFFLKIGDPNKTVTTEHKYTIAYDVRGGLHYFADEAPELYWDAIGAESAVAIATATVTVRDEASLLTGESACYVGTRETNTRCPAVTHASGTYTYTIANLAPYEGVTIAFDLQERVPTVVLERFIMWYLIVPLIVLVLLGFVVFMYHYHTAHRTGRTIVVQYEPYAGFKPMYTGVLFDDHLHAQDITACIVYLAEQGYLRIKKTDRKVMFFMTVDDYEIALKKVPGSELSRFQKSVLSLLFDDLKEGSTITLSQLKADLPKQQANQNTLQTLSADLRKDLADQGFFQNLVWSEWRTAIIACVGVTAVLLVIFAPLAIVLVVLVILFLALSRRRTRKGYEALDHLKGFKEFLSVTEKERYKFHNAPAKSPEQFMEFLPYAIAFGVEKEWAEVFKDITIPTPAWYDGGTNAAFVATNLTESLGAFSTAFASSASSSSGGSGGGGSVGGGGGGGSVGSW